MVMRELISGEPQARPKETPLAKAERKVNEFIAKIPAETSDEERLEKFTAFFNMVSRGTNALADNFEIFEYHARRHTCNTPEKNKENMINELTVGVNMMQRLVEEMEKIPLIRVNGTSVKFMECARNCNTESLRLVCSTDVYETNGLPSNKNGCFDKLIEHLRQQDLEINNNKGKATTGLHAA